MTRKTYKNRTQKQRQLSLFDWAAKQSRTPNLAAVRYVQHFGIRSPSLALLIAEHAGLHVGVDHE